ncbi:TAP-like protein [Amycolatopsis xylanica]|uniref:TAP-like protein n=1 Tax=Amycolatopsis xylanica TaxID=589385 RepID=A0A1H3KAJ5_9PSEU|nr:alpha/beta fold hydrolase [Amycolatopsis xylanica]SDY48574.1 TAP-like protein [Amycolatopsis xylanica]
MMIKKFLGLALSGLVLLPFAPGVASAETLRWRPCREIAPQWASDDDLSECVMVTVPVDYAEPDGRTFELAVSRIKATGRRDGVILLNPGGPGASGLDMPRSMLRSKAAGLGVHHDLIGFSPRGVGHGECPGDYTPPDPALSEKEKARFEAERDGRKQAECAAADPEFVRNLTTSNIARDMDRIRQALGEKKIGYYGTSWGTALGAHYRTLFDGNVDKMLLDSVMAPAFDLMAIDRGQMTANETHFHEFSAWLARNDDVYHFGTTAPDVTKALLDLRAKQTIDRTRLDYILISLRADWPKAAAKLVKLRDGIPLEPDDDDGGVPLKDWEFTRFQATAVQCNESTGSRDFDTIWRDRLDLIAKLPVSGSHGKYDRRCVGWPFPATPWRLTGGASPLQLVGHTYEAVTPIGWARDMRKQIGGALLTVEDDQHLSLSRIPCAEKALEFFDTGKTSNDSCPGIPTPPALAT